VIADRNLREALLAAADYADVRVVGWRTVDAHLFVTVACERGMRTHTIRLDDAMRQRRLAKMMMRRFCDWTTPE